MESKNEQSKPLGICSRFLNSLSRNSAFRHLRHHLLNRSSLCESKLVTMPDCEGTAIGVAKDAAAFNVDPMKEMAVERGICIVSQNELYSEMEDEPYLVSHEDAFSASQPVEEKSCGEVAELPDEIMLVSAGKESATQLKNHIEGRGESHGNDEEIISNSSIEVQAKRHLDSSSGSADSRNNQLETARSDFTVQLQTDTMKTEFTLHDDMREKGSDSGITLKVTEAKIGEKGHTEVTQPWLEHSEKEGTAKGMKPPRPRRNERPSVLIKRRRTTARAGLSMEPMLL